MGDRRERILLFGKSFINKEVRFERILNKIQAKYRKWFNKSTPREINQKHSNLRSHLRIFFRGSKRRIEFRPDSELPAVIKKECIAGYDEVWKLK